MATNVERRIEPPAEILDAAREWLAPVRQALGPEFLAAYLTGSVLSQGFDSKHSRVNLLLVARALDGEALERVRRAIPPATRKGTQFEPLFMTRIQIESSLDSFPIEWMEILERHLRIEGEDALSGLDVPQTYLRLQCEHELRAKHILMRQAFLASGTQPETLSNVLRSSASSFATLFRTLLRLQGETPPASHGLVIERIAVLFKLDAGALLGAHLVRYSGKRHTSDEITAIYRKFLGELDRLVIAIDRLRVA
jgi:hypothetical protein